MAQFYGYYNHPKGVRTDTTEDCPLKWVSLTGNPYRWKMLRVGDVVDKLCAYGTHRALCEITKINRKSISCIELPGSYAPGTLWRFGSWIAEEGQYMKALHLAFAYTPHERLVELAQMGWDKEVWEY